MSESKTKTSTGLKLETLAGPTVETIIVDPEQHSVFGRSSASDVRLPDSSVSRRHALVEYQHEQWFITDLESRHGTFVNGVQLEPQTKTPLKNGDLLRLGPWTFRARSGPSSNSGTRTTDDSELSSQRVERVSAYELASLAQQRLTLLIDCAAAIGVSQSEDSLAETVLNAAMQGTGYARAAFLRSLGGETEVDVVACRGTATAEDFTFSRSLLAMAREGEVARLTSAQTTNTMDSIVNLGIHSALCAPIILDETVEAYLYLDARGSERRVQSDAAAFCQAVARLASMALGNIRAAEYKLRQRQLERDLDAAREAQRLIVPASAATVGRVRYSVHMHPGRIVAGDLFDVVRLEDGRVAVCLGDVRGQGVGAAILMATAQSHLHASLRELQDPAKAIDVTNRYISERTEVGRFLSLWLGVFDAESESLTYVDGGHGWWTICEPGGQPHFIEHESDLLLGVDADYQYTARQLPLTPGTRLVVFSDGVIEQASPSGELFGVSRVLESLKDATSAAEDVSLLSKSVGKFSQADALADDATIASIEILDA